MRVLLIYNNKPRLTFGFLPGPYGLESIRARLSSISIECDIVNPFLSRDPKEVIKKSIHNDTFLIGISLRNIDDALVLWDVAYSGGNIQTEFCLDDVKGILSLCRKFAPGVPIVLGGAPVLHMQERLLRYLTDDTLTYVSTEQDFVCHALKIVASQRNLFNAFDNSEKRHIPVIQREDIYFKYREEAAVRTFTGCPLSCSHCIEHVASKKIKRVDIMDVAYEIETVVKNYAGVKRIFFADSEVNLAGKNRTMALIKEIRSRQATRHIPLAGYFNPRPMSFNFLQSLLKNKVKVLLTVDHVSDTILSRNGKNFRKHHLETLVTFYRELGMELSFCLLLGQPGETRETVDEVLKFVEQIPDEIRGPIYFSPGLRVYPSTPIERLLMEGRLDSRWLIGNVDPIHPFIRPVIYCESWNPFELFGYIKKHGNGLIQPMNAYMCDVKGQNMNLLQAEFHNYHIGLAEMEKDKLSAWYSWSDIRPDAPFLSSRNRIDFLWERGLLALENGLPHNSLDDWLHLRTVLQNCKLTGIGIKKLEHNIKIAKHLLKSEEESKVTMNEQRMR